MSALLQTLQNEIPSLTVERNQERKDHVPLEDKMNRLNLNVKLGASILGAVIADALTESPAERAAREEREAKQREKENLERDRLAKQLRDTEQQLKLLVSAKGGDPNSFTLNRSLNPSMNELKELLAQATKEKEALNKG